MIDVPPLDPLRRRTCVGFFAVCVAAALSGAPVSAQVPLTEPEVRALWVLRSSLETPESIREMVSSAAAHGFNTLFVQVRGRGDAYVNQGVELRAPALARQPAGFDPLADTLRHARARGLRVHAWVNVNLVASAAAFPASREHVVYAHPEWLMVPRAIATEMLSIDPESPEYLGRLARWTRANADRVEGLYASPLHPEANAHLAAVVGDLAARYPLDGVHLDYVRYPGSDFDYSRGALARFRDVMHARLSPEERERLDRIAVIDPFAYPNELAEEWEMFRRSELTALITRLRSAVKAVRPSAVVSAAVAPDVEIARRDTLQDWQTWLDAGFIDVLCPMAYTAEAQQFADQVTRIRDIAGSHPIWAGIGAYRLSPRETIANIATARRLGADGIILFSYDSLTSPPNGVEYLAAIARAVFATGTD